MIQIPVTSSNIKSIGHENDILHVVYKHGGVYEFREVSKDVFETLLNAPSVGRELNGLGLKGLKLQDEKND